MTGTLLCSAADARRLASIPATKSDADIEKAIEAVSGWFMTVAKRTFGDEGTASFHNARLDDMFNVAAEDIEVSEVRTYGVDLNTPVNTFTSIDQWQVIDGHIVQVIPFLPAFSVEDLAAGLDAATIKFRYSRVEIDWTSDTDVPPAVRDGIGLCSGAVVKRGAAESGNIQSEKIGNDYSYVLNTKGAEVHLSELSPMGWALLKPYIRRRVVVI